MGIQQCYVCDCCNSQMSGNLSDALQRGFRALIVGEPSEGPSAPTKEFTQRRIVCGGCMASFAVWVTKPDELARLQNEFLAHEALARDQALSAASEIRKLMAERDALANELHSLQDLVTLADENAEDETVQQ